RYMNNNLKITSKEANDYATLFTSEELPVLQELRVYTEQNVAGAQMISGHLQGALLAMMSNILQPKYILEIGTYTGYATICLAQGLAKDGMIHTIDIDEKLNDIRFAYWKKSGIIDKVQLHIAAAADVAQELDTVFDLILIVDVKKNYCIYYEQMINV